MVCCGGLLAAQSPEYYRDIAPMINRSCMPCHQGNNIGPMALTDYKKVAAYGQMINYVTQKKIMPPFRAVAPEGHFAGEQRLSKLEIETISEWIKAGMPEGEPPFEEKGLAAKTRSSFTFDLSLGMTEPFEQYGVYYDQYRVFVLPTGLRENKWVSGISFEPGNKTIVRSMVVSVDTSNQSQPLDDWDPQYGYFSFGGIGFIPYESRWFSWSAGEDTEAVFPEEPRWLPKNARLLLHIHYGPTGIPQQDSSGIKLRWATEPVLHPVRTAPLINPYVFTNDSFSLKANEERRIHAKFRVPYDLTFTNIFPHAHFLGRKFEVFAVFPDGNTTKLLLRVDDWDFHFKRGYEFLNPVFLPEGTVIHTLATYDNTVHNLSNPNDPPRTTGWGNGMYEEMFLVYFSYRPGHKSTVLIPGAINVFKPRGKLEAMVPEGGLFQLEIANLTDDASSSKLHHTRLDKGLQLIDYDLSELPYGNYIFRLKSEQGEIVDQQIFVYMSSDLFD